MRFLFAFFLLLISTCVNAQQFYLFVSGYTNGNTSEGIAVYKFNAAKGELNFISKIAGIENPSFMAISKDEKYLYCIHELKDKRSGVSAYAIDKSKGTITFINHQPTGSNGACHIAIDTTGRFLVVSNYSDGSINVLTIKQDGSVNAPVQTIEHDGYGIHGTRQTKAHAHSSQFSPDGKYVFTADLGNDRFYQYQFNAKSTTPLEPSATPYQSMEDGSGPRHFVFHPNGKSVYVLNELSGTVTAFRYQNETLSLMQNIVSTAEGDKADKGSADIHITPNGKFLYTSNRGKSNSITIFKIDTEGKLTEVGKQKTGEHPRNFTIDPTGRFLLVANKNSNTIQIFSINANYGLLQDTGNIISYPSPSCLLMIPVK